MRVTKKSKVALALLVLAIAAALWFGGGYLWHMLLAMHGNH